MRKRFSKYISVVLSIMTVVMCLSSCWVAKSYNTMNTHGGSVPVTDTEPVYETETEPPETETETEPEETYDIELESDSDTESDTTCDENGYYKVVIEENIFGEYVPPEPETTEAQDNTVYRDYEPFVPTGSGRAPLALMYHLILDTPYSSLESLFVRPSELEGHIQALLESGYTFIFADEYAYSDEKTVIMSFDDGYIDNYEEMFPIIKKYNVKVTVFMISGYIGGSGYLTESMIREMAGSGLVSFQSHTHTHQGLTGCSADTMRYEFAESKRILESITGRKVRALCYPSGGYNNLAMSVGSEYFDFAYTTESTLTTANYPAMKLPRFRVSRGLSKAYFKTLLP